MIETLFNIAVRTSPNVHQRTMIDTLFNVAARCLIAAAFMPWRGGSPLGRVTGPPVDCEMLVAAGHTARARSDRVQLHEIGGRDYDSDFPIVRDGPKGGIFSCSRRDCCCW